MKRFTKFLHSNISGKKVLGLFILTNAVYLFMLSVTIPKTMGLTHGMKLLDMMPTGYDFNYVKALFNVLGDGGRELYLTRQLPVDMIYPLLFGLTYCLLLAYFLNKINKLNTPFRYLCLIPIVAGIADYMENFGIIVLLKSYPNLTETAAQTTNLFSVLKSMATTIFFVVLIIVLILLGIKRLKKIKSSTNEV